MRKWFWLYLTSNVGLVAYLLYVLLYSITHLMSRTPLDFHGIKAYLTFSLAPFVFSQGSNYAERRIKKIAAEGAEGSQTEMPWWFRVIDRIVTILWVPTLLLMIALCVLTWKGWFAS